jgi:hypothetical protein
MRAIKLAWFRLWNKAFDRPVAECYSWIWFVNVLAVKVG